MQRCFFLKHQINVFLALRQVTDYVKSVVMNPAVGTKQRGDDPLRDDKNKSQRCTLKSATSIFRHDLL